MGQVTRGALQASRLKTCGAGLLAALLTGLALPAQAGGVCDQTEFQTLLQPAAAVEARGYWLNRQLLQWPQLAAVPQARFKLYFSAKESMQVRVGQPVSGADGQLALQVWAEPLPADLASRFKFIANGPQLSLRAADLPRLGELLKQQLLLVQETPSGIVLAATAVQTPGALDDLYAAATELPALGASPQADGTAFTLWAPTARSVALCRYASGSPAALAVLPDGEAMQFDARTGAWTWLAAADLSGQYYRYAVQVFAPGTGWVRNLVTDPYSVSLNTDSKRSYVADLAALALKPAGWDSTPRPQRVKRTTDLVIYELHVRDFSTNDATVAAPKRGKYAAFSETGSNGMKHLVALSAAGVTDVHLLPVFDIASVPEVGCKVPVVPRAAADSELQQAAVMAVAATDCFNWGYDPLHFNAPEGSYASDAADGARRIIEFRQMVLALHRVGLRVGMDMVYNHTAASGQHEQSVLDRIVPGYYQRLDARGAVERSTCCDNTATEHRMMARLMLDSAALWAREYKIDSFRFDLMAHQPRAVMERLQLRVDAAAGQPVQLIGEGWNFGEVASGARFVQASQLSLNGSGIATFSDRGRDAARGGSASDSGLALIKNQGYLNGLGYAPNELNVADKVSQPSADLLQAADLMRVGLAGTLRDYELLTWRDQRRRLADIPYGDQPAGYASEPGEVVNYVDNHDNQTLFDINVFKLPLDTSREDRARVQMLGAAVTAFSQGVAYFHAGIDLLRSKSLDRNSYDSGDWFNRLDWSYQDNGFAAGLPPKADNGEHYTLLRPLLTDARIKPGPAEIAWTRDMFRDLLRIRASSSLFRLPSSDAVKQRLQFLNTGSGQNPVVLAAVLDGTGLADAGFKRLLYFVNVAPQAQQLTLPTEIGIAYSLHPVHLNAAAADKRPAASASFDPSLGRFTVPALTALVWVQR